MRQSVLEVLGDQPRDGLTIDLGRELAARAERDQAAVQRLSEAQGRKARDAALLNKLAVFNENSRRAVELYERRGFPRRSEVGDRGLEHFWLMVQHADDSPEFQLRVLREAVAPLVDSEALAPRFYAMLWDRAHRNKGKPQRYGTQFRFDSTGRAVPQRLEDPERVDARRAELGLGTLEDYLEEMTEAVRGPV